MLTSSDYPAISALSAVLRYGSFERAAVQLNVTPSAISQRIKTLEERLGAALVIRGQPCKGTEIGIRLARHMREVGLLEASVARDLGKQKADTPIRIAVNADSLATWIVPALAKTDAFLFDLVIDDQDHSADWLRRGEVSAAVTAHATPVQGCDAIALGALRYVATASPEFVARWFPEGPTPEALATAPALTFDMKDRLQRDWASAEAGVPIAMPTHYIPSSTAFVEAAILGLGWGLNPQVLVQEHISNGQLVTLSKRVLDTPLTWQWNRLIAPALKRLTHEVRKAASGVLETPTKQPI